MYVLTIWTDSVPGEKKQFHSSLCKSGKWQHNQFDSALDTWIYMLLQTESTWNVWILWAENAWASLKNYSVKLGYKAIQQNWGSDNGEKRMVFFILINRFCTCKLQESYTPCVYEGDACLI